MWQVEFQHSDGRRWRITVPVQEDFAALLRLDPQEIISSAFLEAFQSDWQGITLRMGQDPFPDAAPEVRAFLASSEPSGHRLAVRLDVVARELQWLPWELARLDDAGAAAAGPAGSQRILPEFPPGTPGGSRRQRAAPHFARTDGRRAIRVRHSGLRADRHRRRPALLPPPGCGMRTACPAHTGCAPGSPAGAAAHRGPPCVQSGRGWVQGRPGLWPPPRRRQCAGRQVRNPVGQHVWRGTAHGASAGELGSLFAALQPAPLLVLDVPAPPVPAERLRQFCLRTAFSSDWGTHTLGAALLGVGLGTGDPQDHQTTHLAELLAAGTPLRRDCPGTAHAARPAQRRPGLRAQFGPRQRLQPNLAALLPGFRCIRRTPNRCFGSRGRGRVSGTVVEGPTGGYACGPRGTGGRVYGGPCTTTRSRAARSNMRSSRSWLHGAAHR